MTTTTTYHAGTHPCQGCMEPISGTCDYCEACKTKPVYKDFTHPVLSTAFDSVANKDNWKLAIDHTFGRELSEFERRAIEAAVVFFTGSVATVAYSGGKTRVRAKGYYEAIGA